MPWFLGLVTLAAADPKLALNKWSGCGEVTAGAAGSFPLYFEPCATAEWEVLTKPSELTAKLKLPEADNLLGCAEHSLDFDGGIVLLQRGACYFSWKVLLAQAAGAGAVLIFDTAPVQVTAILAVPGPLENPKIPGFLISRSQGEELLIKLERGEEVQILCSWSPVNVWFNLPEDSPESNDSIILQNYGDEDMPWVVDMIANNASFETDPFYTVHLLGPNDTAASFEMEAITVFNTSDAMDFRLLKLPFQFPHYLDFKTEVVVSANGVLVFDQVFSNIVGTIADSVAPAALIAPLWAHLSGGTVSVRGDTHHVVLRFHSFWLKSGTVPSGPFTFEVCLFNDGEIRIHWEAFPNSSWPERVEIGLEPGSGARALSIGRDIPWFRGPPLAVSLVPCLKLCRRDDALPPKQSLSLTLSTLSTGLSSLWLFFYARKSLGTWHPRRNVRIVQRSFRHLWVLSAWDGGLHSGTCAKGFVRRRTRNCVGSDGASYDESHCMGSCVDITPEYNFDYPVKHQWRDGYNNLCQDYEALSFCNGTGYGPKWQSRWGTFEDWVSASEFGELGAGEACCVCGGGHVVDPVLSEECPTVKCPMNSVGLNVLHGCRCLEGYQGQVKRSDRFPYYAGQCSPVSCPEHSSGHHVADGCLCVEGYSGTIIPSKAEPFFVGTCQETAPSVTSTKGTTSKPSTTSITSTRTFTSPENVILSTTLSQRTEMLTIPERRSEFHSTAANFSFSTSSTRSLTNFWTSTSASFASTTSPTTSQKDEPFNTVTDSTSSEALLPPILDNLTLATTKSSTQTYTTWIVAKWGQSTSISTLSRPILSTTSQESSISILITSSTTSRSSTSSSSNFSSLSKTDTTSSTSRGQSLESQRNEQSPLDLFGAELFDPKGFAIDTEPTASAVSTTISPTVSTTHRIRNVTAMVTQGTEGSSASALIVVLLAFMPFCACFCGAGRLLCAKASGKSVHPEPSEASESPNRTDRADVVAPLYSDPVTVRAAVR